MVRDNAPVALFWTFFDDKHKNLEHKKGRLVAGLVNVELDFDVAD
jgi:hypothetical protein